MISTTLQSIADTLAAHAEEDDALTPSQCAALGATIRSLGHRVAQMEDAPIPASMRGPVVREFVLVRGGRA